MEDRKSSVKRWKSREEELASLERNPIAQALLRDLEQQDPERVAELVDELQEQIKKENEGRGQQEI